MPNDIMSMSFTNRSMSLVERKKLQWAKEREELASLCAPWGPLDQPTIDARNKYEPKILMVNNDYLKKNSNRESGSRRGSLPPLYKNQYNSYDRYEKDRDIGGETSGYGSDSNNQTPESVQNWHQSGYESSSSRDDRPKWGDKGVGMGRFWRPKEEILERITTSDPPNWVKRGLKDGEIVVNNTSPSESPEQICEEPERPYTGSSFSQTRNTYIRGQNIPLDSIEIAERERKRQIAMAHQEAIRQQLEDKERKKREEKERKIREEHEEELRIEREQEIERLRKEEEFRQKKEKQERERKRKEAIQEAIELAQKEAQLAKMKKKVNNNINLAKNNVDEGKNKIIIECSENESPKKLNPDVNDKVEEKNSNSEQLNNTKIRSPRAEILNNEISANLEIRGKSITSPRVVEQSNNNNHTNIPESPPNIDNNLNQTVILNNLLTNRLSTPRIDNLALVVPTSLDALPTIQYALLVPATPQNMSVAIPLNTEPHSARSISTARTENRILTPTQYRNRNVLMCDNSTQTEESVFRKRDYSSENKEKYVREKLTNLELTYDNRCRRDRRSRSESLEERPKWGANRPPTRYLKQSEKDPLYQRRKLKQKIRENKNYDDRNSSDESQTASPRSFRRKTYPTERTTTRARALWRRNDQLFTRNIKMYQTEIIPLDSDKDQIYYKNNDCCCTCRCGRHRCSDGNVKVDILKIEHNSPRENIEYKAEVIEKTEKLPDVNELNHDLLNKLSVFHNGLMLKQEQWENVPNTPPLSSSK